MSIYDRDWYRDQHRKTGRRAASATARRAPHAGWTGWIVGGVVVVALLMGAKLLAESRRDLPFPPTGRVHWYVAHHDEGPQAPLTIVAPANDQVQYAVQLDDWESHAPVAMVPVRGREVARVEVPLGRYRLTMTKGLGWRGPGPMFRMNTVSIETTQPLAFYAVGREITGHTIRLETFGGNLETRPVRR